MLTAGFGLFWVFILFYFNLFFGGFGFLHLTEQALALAEWGDLAEHCFSEVQKTLSPSNSTHLHELHPSGNE